METFEYINCTTSDNYLENRYKRLQEHLPVVERSEARRAQVVREMTHIAFEQSQRITGQIEQSWEEHENGTV